MSPGHAPSNEPEDEPENEPENELESEEPQCNTIDSTREHGDNKSTWNGVDETFENETFQVTKDQEATTPTQTRTENNPTSPQQIGTYDILDELGRGGMGVVYKAQDLRLKRTVALKVILAGSHAGSKDRERFQTEAEAVARLQHPSIVQVYEVGESEGHPFLALEYCSGGSLSERLQQKPSSPRKSAELVATIADAMEHSHQAGVVHRDLKPANVLFDSDGIPKIADFGLAKKIDEDEGHTRTGTIMGSLAYMSPEQASGQTANINHSTDIYSMGAILYSMLAGHPPFQSSTAVETLNLVIDGDPVPIRRAKPECPRDLETICLKCLHKLPADRYATSKDFSADLRRFLRGEPIHARPSTAYEQLFSWSRRNPLPTSLAIASVLMLAILSASFAWITHRNQAVIQRIETRDMRVADLRGKILFLDEVLTNSCALASLTNDPTCVERYREHEPLLISAIDEAVSLVPEAKSELDKVNDANKQLVEIEGKAFALIAEDQSSAAWDLLSGDYYKSKKKDYENGLQLFTRKLSIHSEQTVRAAKREAYAFLITAVVFAGIVIIVFAIGLSTLFRMTRSADHGTN